jgi:hypothetical protein
MIEQTYTKLCNTPSDINEHLPTLRRYAEECEHITEMGVRWVVSTWALLSGGPKKIVSYDIEHPSRFGVNFDAVFSVAQENGIDFSFHEKNVLEVEIEPTDMLFIDTVHNYEQLKAELHLHSQKVKKYIVLHDTMTFGNRNETTDGPGLLPAMHEFLFSNRNWIIKEQYLNNNGLTILERVSQ